MDHQTIEVYDRLADTMIARQERFTHSYISELEYLLKDESPSDIQILDIGTGSGKWLELLTDRGWQAIGLEPSAAIRARIQNSFPKRAEKIHDGSLPDLPHFPDKFHLVSCLAVLSHIPRRELFLSLFRIKEIILEGGYFLYSLPQVRNDLEANDRDAEGRLLYPYNAFEINLILEQMGFTLAKEILLDDAEGRGFSWNVFIFQCKGSVSLPLHSIHTILNLERKTATYKPALLRAFCDIALENQAMVVAEEDLVWIPLRLIAKKWVVYFWNLFSSPIFMPQVSSEKPDAPSNLRKTFERVTVRFQSLDDFLDKQALIKEGRLIDLEAQKEINQYITLWERTILKGPIQYSSDGLLFQFDPKRQSVSLPQSVWREFVLLESWIRDAVILRWAEEIERLSHGTIRTGQAIDHLRLGQDLKRKQNQVRDLFLQKDPLLCLWSGKKITNESLDVDHAIPYTYWKNNFLWNLFPTDANTNKQKRDLIPGSSLLLARAEEIKDHWHFVSANRPNQFHFEIKNFLGKYYHTTDWAITLYSMFVESMETLAIRRGIERWDGPR